MVKSNQIIPLIFILLITLFAKVESNGSPNRNGVDSLIQKVPQLPQNEKVLTLFKIFDYYLSVSQTSAITYGNLALIEARKTNNLSLLAQAYKNLGNAYYYQGNQTEVEAYFDSSLTIYRRLGDTVGMAKVWNNLGVIYNQYGAYDEALNYHIKSLELKNHLGDSIGITNSLINIGSVYFSIHDYSKSANYFRMALEYAENTGLPGLIQAINNNFGLISQEIGNYEQAFDYFNKSLEVSLKLNNMKGIADSYHNIARNNFLIKNYNIAIENYNKAIENYSSAGIQSSKTWNNLGQLYLELDYYKQAAELFSKAEDIAKSFNQTASLRDIYLNQSILSSRSGDYKNAYNYYVLYNQLDDSIAENFHIKKLNEVEEDWAIQLQKKVQENDEKTAQSNQDIAKEKEQLLSYLFLGGLAIVLIFTFVLLRLYQGKKSANKKLNQQNDDVLRSQSIIKKINRALSDSEDKLRSIFDVSPFAILVLNSDLKILDCNDTSNTTFGATNKRDLLGRSFEGFILNTSGNAEIFDIAGLVNRKALNKKVYELKHVDGSNFSAEVTGRKITDSNSGTVNYIVVVTDITERLRFIKTLEEAKLKAEESDVLKTAFLTNMSHEIRTPMNSIVGFSNLLLDSSLEEDLRSQYLSHILESSSVLMKLIDDIIDISKIESGQLTYHPEKINPISILHDTFQVFSSSNKKEGVEFEFIDQLKEIDVTASIDPVRLKQVLLNLLNNAKKFTSRGKIETVVKLTSNNGDNEMLVFVRDTGIGIPENKLNLIFERFRQVDDSRTRNFGGTGLGLSISKNLVKLMRGKIWVESIVNEGTTFYFTFPCTNSDNEAQGNNSNVDENEKFWKNRKILVAEDENSNFELIKASLLNTGVTILRAGNGEEAIKLVKENPEIDLILMDIRMPRMNGYDATREIKKIRKELPVISITAYAMSEDEAKSKEAGCDYYLSKPIKPNELKMIMGEFLGENGSALKNSVAE